MNPVLFALHAVMQVGPNGSGKSNLLEALMFAAGAPSTDMRVKSLRELCNSASPDQVWWHVLMGQVVGGEWAREVTACDWLLCSPRLPQSDLGFVPGAEINAFAYTLLHIARALWFYCRSLKPDRAS